jgi:hypothetical protein
VTWFFIVMVVVIAKKYCKDMGLQAQKS